MFPQFYSLQLFSLFFYAMAAMAAMASIIFQLAAAYIIGSLIKLSLAAVLDINRSVY